VTARNVAGLVDTLERDGLTERLPHPTDRRAILVRLTPAGDRLAGELLTEQRPPSPSCWRASRCRPRHLLQALASLRAVLARHPNASPLATSMGRNGQPRRVLQPPPSSPATVRPACGNHPIRPAVRGYVVCTRYAGVFDGHPMSRKNQPNQDDAQCQPHPLGT
jgi:DNA-binding MarR family transcriptional regulator